MRPTAFNRREEPLWLCCRTCLRRDGPNCGHNGIAITWPQDWYGCGDYVAGDVTVTQTTLEVWR